MNIYEQSKKVGRDIVRLGKNKKSFGSFVKLSGIEDIDKILPWIEQSVWSLPMSNDLLIRFENNHETLDKLNDYDFSLVFVYRYGKNSMYIEHVGNNIYHCVVQARDSVSLKKLYGDFVSGICQDNPYVKIYNDLVNKKCI